jgi:hypothetical protein
MNAPRPQPNGTWHNIMAGYWFQFWQIIEETAALVAPKRCGHLEGDHSCLH